MELSKIVITGGPCGGKSTAMEFVKRELSQKGYTVLYVPETATELITGGVAPWTCGSVCAYQTCQLELQLEKERIYEEAARTMSAEKILLLFDRGALDNKAYLTADEFSGMMKHLHASEDSLRNRYDAVFHLVSAAKGAEEYYTTSNNAARTETPEEAAVLDDKLRSVWQAHSHYYVIDNSTDFEQKLRRLVSGIQVFLEKNEDLR